MTEVVEAEILKASFAHNFVPGGGDVRGAAAVARRKDVRTDDDSFFLFDVEDVEEMLRKGYGAGFAVFGVAKVDCVVVEVDIRPGEIEDFAATSACG